MAYASKWISRQYEIVQIASDVKAQHPEAWAEVKIPGQKSRTFINLVAAACQARLGDKVVDGVVLRGKDVGCNLKRGGPDLSLDVLALPNESGCADATGKFPGLELIDIIASAEGPSANLSWGDVTQTTISSGVPGGWKAPAGTAPAPVPVVPGREEALFEMQWLDGYYRSQEGLQRPQGLSLHGSPDFEGIAAWYLDVYQKERMAGKSPTDARAAYVNQIRHSDEWKAKHPGETP